MHFTCCTTEYHLKTETGVEDDGDVAEYMAAFDLFDQWKREEVLEEKIKEADGWYHRTFGV